MLVFEVKGKGMVMVMAMVMAHYQFWWAWWCMAWATTLEYCTLLHSYSSMYRAYPSPGLPSVQRHVMLDT